MSAPLDALRKLELGDLFIFLYLTVLLRQCWWAVEADGPAWALTLSCAAALWAVHLRLKEPPEARTPRQFWLVVALPLLLFYALRVALPDLSFDVLNHRLIQAERGLRGALLLPGDFFPTIFPFNPASDMLAGIGRRLLGYRLGTLVNYLSLLWAGMALDKLLRPYVGNAWARSLGVLLVLVTEHVLFEVNTYMVDLLMLPLLLEATRLALRHDEAGAPRDLVRAGLYLGVCVAFKLTNAAMVAPVVLLLAGKFLRSRPRTGPGSFAPALLAAAAFLLPLVPHAAYIYRETGSPFFPMYNEVFRSPLWPEVNVYDGRWGPKGLWETLGWPLLATLRPERLSELAVYSGRLSAGLVAAALCLLVPRADRRARLLSFVVLLGSLLWSGTSGYIRYALYLELAGGLLVLYLAHLLAGRLRGAAGRAAAALVWAALGAQCAVAGAYAYGDEWSRRRTLAEEPGVHRRELRYVWRDRDLLRFVAPEKRALFGRVEVWVAANIKTNGVEALLRPDVPVLAVHNLEYFDAPEARRRFARALREARGKRLFSLCYVEDLEPSLAFIRRRGLEVGEVVPVRVPFFSEHTQLHMALVEVVRPAGPAPAGSRPAVTEAREALPDDAFEAGITVAAPPAALRAGQKQTVYVSVTNASERLWPARGQADGRFLLTVADSWLGGSDEKLVTNMDGRAGLPRDLGPGERAELPLVVTAPRAPGEYVLEIDMVQEGVTWFKDRGSRPFRARVRVE